MSKNKWISEEFVEDLVSVIIPTYNRKFLLTAAIQSIIVQTYRPIECIIVDDGSTENIKELVNIYSINNSPSFSIYYKFQTNAGPQVARNTGTVMCKGEYIQYLDSDDLIYPGKLTSHVNFLKENLEFDAIFGDWEIGTEDNKKLIKAHKEADMIQQLIAGRSIANFSFLMRRSLIKKTGAWDINLKTCHETDYHLTALTKGGRFEYQPLLCGLWRSHNEERFENTTRLNDIASFYDKWEIILKSKNLLNESLKNKIGHLLIWFIQQNIIYDKNEILCFLRKAVTFNPNIMGFNQSRKYKFLRIFLGDQLAFKIWSSEFRQSLKTSLENTNSK